MTDFTNNETCLDNKNYQYYKTTRRVIQKISPCAKKFDQQKVLTCKTGAKILF